MKYVKKLSIEAVRWSGGNVLEMYNFLEGINVTSELDVKTSGTWFHIDMCNGTFATGDLIISTIEGPIKVNIGDYVIKADGEYYPCKPDIFEKTYELVEDAEVIQYDNMESQQAMWISSIGIVKAIDTTTGELHVVIGRGQEAGDTFNILRYGTRFNLQAMQNFFSDDGSEGCDDQ